MSDKKENKSLLQIAIENQSCMECRLRGVMCRGGHAKGGGGGGEEGEKNDKQDNAKHTPIVNAATQAIDIRDVTPLNDKKFNPEIISEMLSNKALSIDNQNGIIRINFLFHPHLLPKDQKEALEKFIKAIKNEFADFKNNLSDADKKKCTINEDKNGITISILDPKLYNAFIQQLASKHLLPLQNIHQEKEKVAYPKGMNHFTGTPLSTRLEPKNVKYKPDEERRSSLYKIPSIDDGPKPTK